MTSHFLDHKNKTLQTSPSLREAEFGGSNPLIPTRKNKGLWKHSVNPFYVHADLFLTSIQTKATSLNRCECRYFYNNSQIKLYFPTLMPDKG